MGKSIDRSFVAELSGAVPRDAAFSAPQQRPLLDRAIVQHLYRQGLDTVADTLVQVTIIYVNGNRSRRN